MAAPFADFPMVDVFVSYASQDRERVRPLVDALTDVGWTVWWDREIGAGATFDREIEKAIDSAKCVVVVWTDNSVESEWVRTEANEGLEKNILIPVQLEEVRPPLAFRRIQMIDLSGQDYQQLKEVIAEYVPIPLGTDTELTPFVGRDHEKNLLDSRLAAAERGEGDFLLLSGDAGVGKSRLVHELSAEAGNRGWMVLSGHCLDMDGAPPYQPLIEQIEQASRLVDDEVMRQTLGENAPEVSKLMPELRQRYSDIPEPVALPPEQERRYLLHGVSQFISRGATGQPILLVFEDLHWADTSTCILLRYLADRLKESRVLILGTYRDAELDTSRQFSRTLQELNRERLVEDLHLTNLERPELEKLVAKKAGKPPPAVLVDLILSETDGNPFFVEELYRHLLEAGRMFNDNGEFASDIEIADTEVPRGVKLILGERLDQVSDECRTALTIGSVIGRQFNFEVLLSASTKLDEDDLLDALDEAMAERLVTDQSKDREAIYGFAHEQVRQTLLSGLSFPRRQRMHLRIADALESYAGENVDRYVPEIAHHLYQAGAAADEQKTIDYLVKAAERAMTAIAFEDAMLLYDWALGILPDSSIEQVAHIQGRRAAALQGMERFDDALDVLKQAIDMLGAQHADLKDDLVLKRCRVLLDIWRGSQAVGDLESLLERRRQGHDRDKELEAQLWVARARYVESLDKPGYAEKAIDSYEDTIALARELNRPKELGQALVASSQLADYAPSYVIKAREHLEEAQQIARDIGSEDLEIEVATARLNVYLSEDEEELGEIILEKLENRRDPIRLNAHYFRMMWSTYSSGKLHRCIEICDKGVELAYRIGTLPVQYPTIKGLALMDLGEFSLAWQSLGEEIADEDHRFGAALQDMGRLQYELDLGAFEAAMSRAPHVIEEAHALSRVWMLGWVGNALARTVAVPGNAAQLDAVRTLIDSTGITPDRVGQACLDIAAGNYGDAEQMLVRLVRKETRYLEVRRKLVGLQLLTQTYGHMENWQAMIETGSEALETARNCQMKPYQWKLLVSLAAAQKAVGDPDTGSSILQEAESIWTGVNETVPDPAHRQAHTLLAENLGL